MNHKRLSNFSLRAAQNAALESRGTVERGCPWPQPTPSDLLPSETCWQRWTLCVTLSLEVSFLSDLQTELTLFYSYCLPYFPLEPFSTYLFISK